MRQTLEAACQVLCGYASTVDMQDWQLAERIIEYWNGSKFSEIEAKIVLSLIIVYVIFPNLAAQERVVQRAEAFAEEVFDELVGHDPHMDWFAAWLARHGWKNI